MGNHSAEAYTCAPAPAELCTEFEHEKQENEIINIPNSVVHDAVAMPIAGSGPTRRCIGDTGSGNHLVGTNELSETEKASIRESAIRLRLHTANGEVLVNQCVDLTLDSLREKISPLVLANTPAVISIGRFCMEQGARFDWRPGVPPVMTLTDGRKINFDVEHNVPYIDELQVRGAGS